MKKNALLFTTIRDGLVGSAKIKPIKHLPLIAPVKPTVKHISSTIENVHEEKNKINVSTRPRKLLE